MFLVNNLPHEERLLAWIIFHVKQCNIAIWKLEDLQYLEVFKSIESDLRNASGSPIILTVYCGAPRLNSWSTLIQHSAGFMTTDDVIHSDWRRRRAAIALSIIEILVASRRIYSFCSLRPGDVTACSSNCRHRFLPRFSDRWLVADRCRAYYPRGRHVPCMPRRIYNVYLSSVRGTRCRLGRLVCRPEVGLESGRH